jgi:DNA-binding response OmpR family regulator
VKILVVDDDADMLDVTTYALRKHGYQVITGTNGQQALERWERDRPDLVVLDITMPRKDGFEVLKQIRETSLTPVIMLTGKSDEESVVQGFTAGADDYVAKPFSHKQLAMRIRAVLNRSAGQVAVEVKGDLETTDMKIDLGSHLVTRNGKDVRLTPLEFKILYVLAANEGHVVSSQRVVEHAWGFEGGDASLLKTHICHIRQKLGMKQGGPTIQAIPWVGYQLTTG